MTEQLLKHYFEQEGSKGDLSPDEWATVLSRVKARRQSGWARVPALVKLVAAAAVVALIAALPIIRPSFLSEDAMSPFAAVAHAYEGLFELETVRYHVDGTNSSGQEFVQHHQVDMVKRIDHSVLQIVTGPALGPRQQEFAKVDGYHYRRHSPTVAEPLDSEQSASESSPAGWSLFPDPMRHPEEGHGWVPFGKLGGFPWSRESTEESFDEVELVGYAAVDSQPVIRYRASRRSGPEDRSGQPPRVSYHLSGERVENVHRGVEDHLTTIDTVDFWVAQDRGMLIKAAWTHTERGPAMPEDFRERDWCQGLGEFNVPSYTFRVTDSSENRSYVTGAPSMSRDTHPLAEVICWNEEKTEGRQLWGRNLPETTGKDFWVRWVYIFTAFNEPLELPDDLPE